MSRFRQEMNIVPRPVWAIAAIVWLAFFLLMFLLPFQQDPFMRHWPPAGIVAISLLPGIPLFILVLLIGYVYADAKRRGRNGLDGGGHALHPFGRGRVQHPFDDQDQP